MISSVVFGQEKKKVITPAKFIGVENGASLYADNSEMIKSYLLQNIVYPKRAMECSLT